MNRIPYSFTTPPSESRPAKTTISAWRDAAALFVLAMSAGCGATADDRRPRTDAHHSASRDSGAVAAAVPRAPEPDEAAIQAEAGSETPVWEDPSPPAAAIPQSAEGVPEPADADPVNSADPATACKRPPADRIDLGKLFIDSAPIPQPSLSPELATELDHVRSAMRKRDFAASGRHLQAADALRRTPADEQAYERMLLVHALWTQGWAQAAAAAGSLAVGQAIETWAGPALVQDKTQRKIMLRIDGVPQTFSLALAEMEVRLAAALVRHRARETGLALDAHAAALWTFAAEDDEDSLESAQEAIIEAVQRGAYSDHLIAELRIRQASAPATR